jgi:hypothetical protein
MSQSHGTVRPAPTQYYASTIEKRGRVLERPIKWRCAKTHTAGNDSSIRIFGQTVSLSWVSPRQALGEIPFRRDLPIKRCNTAAGSPAQAEPAKPVLLADGDQLDGVPHRIVVYRQVPGLGIAGECRLDRRL